jgi:parallel beta-helix repeat protein
MSCESKKRIGIAIGVAFTVLVLLVSGTASAERIDIPADYATIKSGLDHARPGDTIYVHDGTYNERPRIFTSNITLIGADAIIEGRGDDVCLYINARGVKISGFVVQNGEQGIWLEGSAFCVITNNTVFNNRGKGGPNRIVHEGHGIGLTSSSNCIIANNTVLSNSAYGIALFQACNNVISGNRCDQNRDYQIILGTDSCNNTITENTLSGSVYGHGIYIISQSNNNAVTKNVIFNNTNAGINLLSAHYNLISDNILKSNRMGLWIGSILSASNGNIIANNTVTSNQRRGIEVSGDENEIINNTVTGNEEGIYIREGAGNRIYHNQLNNRKNAYDCESNIWDNGYPSGGNYWSDYPNPDIYSGQEQNEPGSDGIGDIPYIIEGNSSDKFPFIGIYIPPISISNVSVSPPTAAIGTQITVCADVSAISGVKDGGVIAIFTRDGAVVEQIRLLDHNKDGRYCHYRYFTEPGIYHVAVIATDCDGHVMPLEDAATFVILD